MSEARIACLVPDLPGTEAILPYLREIDAARWYTNFGPLATRFEAQAAALVGADPPPHCVATASGTLALECALRALGLPAGSRVLVPAFTFPATALAVLSAGHVPVLADVDSASWTLTAALAEDQLDRAACRAVVPVAALGCPVDVAAFDRLASARGIAVVVDGAGAFGAQDVGLAPVAFSLHATKPLGIGEGGLVATRDMAFAQRVRRQSNFGFQQHKVAVPGINAKLSEYAAAVGLAQLARADEVFERRHRAWSRLRAVLQDIDGVTLQGGIPPGGPAVLAVRTSGDGAARGAALATHGIETRRWYCPPLHRHPALAGLPHAGALDVTENLDAHLVGLPFHAFLSGGDCERIAVTLRKVLAAAR